MLTRVVSHLRLLFGPSELLGGTLWEPLPVRCQAQRPSLLSPSYPMKRSFGAIAQSLQLQAQTKKQLGSFGITDTSRFSGKRSNTSLLDLETYDRILLISKLSSMRVSVGPGKNILAVSAVSKTQVSSRRFLPGWKRSLAPPA